MFKGLCLLDLAWHPSNNAETMCLRNASAWRLKTKHPQEVCTFSKASTWRPSPRPHSHARTLAGGGGAASGCVGAGCAAMQAAGARGRNGRKAGGSGASRASLAAAAAGQTRTFLGPATLE